MGLDYKGLCCFCLVHSWSPEPPGPMSGYTDITRWEVMRDVLLTTSGYTGSSASLVQACVRLHLHEAILGPSRPIHLP